jgi:hypothetical protein
MGFLLPEVPHAQNQSLTATLSDAGRQHQTKTLSPYFFLPGFRKLSLPDSKRIKSGKTSARKAVCSIFIPRKPTAERK